MLFSDFMVFLCIGLLSTRFIFKSHVQMIALFTTFTAQSLRFFENKYEIKKNEQKLNLV